MIIIFKAPPLRFEPAIDGGARQKGRTNERAQLSESLSAGSVGKGRN